MTDHARIRELMLLAHDGQIAELHTLLTGRG
jgi:hypothetical protein